MHQDNIRMRDAIIHKIAWFCNRIGQTETSEYFDKVKAGEIDPFDEWKKIREESVGLGSRYINSSMAKKDKRRTMVYLIQKARP